MKVVDGKFGKPEGHDEPAPLGAMMKECLELSELEHLREVNFLLIVDGKERFTFATNEASTGGLLCMLEVAKQAIVNQYLDGEE